MMSAVIRISEFSHDMTVFFCFIFKLNMPITCLGLERCAGEVVTDILKIVESCDSDEAQMRILLQGKLSSYDLVLDI